MGRVAWRTVPVLALVAVATAGVSSGAAAVRHVTPGGAGAACSAASPCGIEVGVQVAAPGDEVVIAGGSYAAGNIAFPAAGGVTVRGAAIGPGRPVVTTGALLVRGPGSRLSDVEIRGAAATAPLSVTAGARGDRLLVTGADGVSTACSVTSGTLTNSVCRGGGAAGSAGVTIAGSSSTLRNVTATSGGHGVLQPTGDLSFLTNAIAKGAANDDVNRSAGGLFGMNLVHSYAVTVQGGPYSSVNSVESGLAFRDAADLRQAPGSATIDAGTPSGVAAGELDLNGNLRIVGPAPDIGAYEQVPAPSVAAGTVEATATTATLRPVVTTGGGRTQVAVRIGLQPGVLTEEVAATAPAGAEPGPVEVPLLPGLAPFTTYHYRVTVTSDGGTGQSAEASFATPARPASATLGETTRIGRLQATVAGTVDTGGAPGQARFELRPVRGGLAVLTPVQALGATDGPRPVTARVTDLAPATDYRVVLILTTPAAGTIRSAAGSLTTLGPPAAPPGNQPDTRGPRVTLRVPAAVRIGRTGALVVRVTCDERCTLSAQARLGVRGGRPARFRLLPKARITLRLRPVRRTRLVDVDDLRLTLTGARRAALTALRAGRRVVVRIDVQAKDAAGNLRRVRAFVTVRR
jgi:hypothetical protein